VHDIFVPDRVSGAGAVAGKKSIDGVAEDLGSSSVR